MEKPLYIGTTVGLTILASYKISKKCLRQKNHLKNLQFKKYIDKAICQDAQSIIASYNEITIKGNIPTVQKELLQLHKKEIMLQLPQLVKNKINLRICVDKTLKRSETPDLLSCFDEYVDHNICLSNMLKKVDPIIKQRIIRFKSLYRFYEDFVLKNAFSAIPAELAMFTNLEIIDFSKNTELRRIPKEIATLKKLKRLDLRDTKLNDSTLNIHLINEKLPLCEIIIGESSHPFLITFCRPGLRITKSLDDDINWRLYKQITKTHPINEAITKVIINQLWRN